MAALVDIVIFSTIGALVVVSVFLGLGYFYGNIVLIGYHILWIEHLMIALINRTYIVPVHK